VRVVSRFQSKKAVEQTLAELKMGKVDVVIGTHRLLSKDVHYKSLGLLIIDEEHRFGVAHKERIKEIRRSVDVLTLSATPIPRTLSLSISGLRDISIISTAPVDRRAVRTLSSLFDQQVIEGAISHELARGGQVFYVVPKVEGIEARAAFLRGLLPRLKVGVAHGQLSESQLERPMHDFVQVPPQAAFHQPIDWYRTALHELGHWTGHASRLGRDQAGGFGSESYAKEELVAEMAAAFTCASLGITPTVRHSDYIASWLSVLRGDEKAIFRAASQASKASDYLLAFAGDEP